jgi:hypothetical protein
MRGVVLHAVLALAGLIAAFVVWRDSGKKAVREGEVNVLACTPETLTRLHFVGDRKDVTVKRVDGGEIASDKPRYEVVVKTEEAAKKSAAKAANDNAKPDDDAKPGADAKPDDNSKPDDNATTRTKHFAGNDNVHRYIEKLTPLIATRSLGALPADERDALGLGAGADLLTVDCGQQLILRLGETSFGAGSRYAVRIGGDGQPVGDVLLVPNPLASDMRVAEFRFMQRDMHTFRLREVDEVDVRVGGAQVTLLHRDKHDRTAAQWVDKAEPEARNELFGNWLARVGRLRAQRYLDAGQEPGDEDPTGAAGAEVEPVVTMTWRIEGEVAGRLEVVRIGAGDETTWYGRSETTRSWVTLLSSVSRQVALDAWAVVGLTPPADLLPEDAQPARALPATSTKTK